MTKGLAGIRQIHVELAARAVFDIQPEEITANKIPLKVYRFDTRTLFGDFTIVCIVAAFACEQAARAALLDIISSTDI